MLRIFTLLVITFALSAPAIAGAPAKDEAKQAEITKTTDRDFSYRSTSERLRGKPYAVRTNTQPAADLTASERVYQFLPAANFMVEGRQGLGSR
jgi:hypothetical protein